MPLNSVLHQCFQSSCSFRPLQHLFQTISFITQVLDWLIFGIPCTSTIWAAWCDLMTSACFNNYFFKCILWFYALSLKFGQQKFAQPKNALISESGFRSCLSFVSEPLTGPSNWRLPHTSLLSLSLKDRNWHPVQCEQKVNTWIFLLSSEPTDYQHLLSTWQSYCTMCIFDLF